MAARQTKNGRSGGKPGPPDATSIDSGLATLAKKYDVDNEDTPVAGMLADLTLANRIRTFASEAATLAQLRDDTLLEAKSESWQAATSL